MYLYVKCKNTYGAFVGIYYIPVSIPSFFDCDNQRKEFEFAEDEDGVSLVRTDETRYIPENNLTSYVTPDGNIYERMRDLIDGVMRDSGY